MMDLETVEHVLQLAQRHNIQCVDLTGGAPELNPHFRYLVQKLHALGIKVIDRCNLTVLLLEDQGDLADFLAAHEVEICASLPCYLSANTDSQRGAGVYQQSITALKKLNQLGYGREEALQLTLVHNPLGSSLPTNQDQLEQEYRRQLGKMHGIVFTHLITITNMPIARFGSTLISQGRLQEYLQVLRAAHRSENLSKVMCKDLISIDWQGYIYDCDFNQMLDLHCGEPDKRVHIKDVDLSKWSDRPIRVADHCYGCTAGCGSSCSGAL